MLASYVDAKHKTWDKFLPEFRFAINTGVHDTTGVTPAELNMGHHLRGPLYAELNPHLTDSDTAAYSTSKHLAELEEFARDNLEKQNRNKNETMAIDAEMERTLKKIVYGFVHIICQKETNPLWPNSLLDGKDHIK